MAGASFNTKHLTRALREASDVVDNDADLEEVAAAAVKAAREDQPFIDVWEADR